MTEKVLNEIFSDSKNTKSLIGLHIRNIGIDDFCVGYVIDFDELFVVVNTCQNMELKTEFILNKFRHLKKLTEGDYLKTCHIFLENLKLLTKNNFVYLKIIVVRQMN